MNILEPYTRFKWKLHFNRLKDEIIAGRIPPPTKATIELTMRCNLNCQMCFRDRDQKEELTFAELKDVIDNLPPSIEEIHLIGGEVFLRKDIFEILDYLSKKGYVVRVHTNGTLLDDEKIKKLSRYSNLLGIGFSIDGTRELHNKIRGSSTAFDKTIDSIKKTAKILPVSVNTVILDENFGQIENIFRIISGLGIREYRLEPEMFCTKEEIKESGVEPIVANIKENGRYGYTAKELKELKKRLDKLAKGIGIKIVIAPRVAEIDANVFITGDIREKKKLFCKHLLVPRIDSRGNLIFCHIIKKSFGNLKGKNLDGLWNSDELKDFRRALLSNNLLPVCKRCCRLRSI
ncbi:MAG: radical SAM/SPASM domain-containing protein [Candidatus Hydrothermarchaeales archaeon]